MVRPELVLADPPVMTTLPERLLRASAMNALAHGADSLYTSLANPVAALATLRGATLIARALDAERDKRDAATLARALRTRRAELVARIERLGGGPRRLSELGAERDGIDATVKGILARPRSRRPRIRAR